MTKLERVIQFIHRLPKPLRYFVYAQYALGVAVIFVVAIPFLIVAIITAYFYCAVADYFETLDIPK